jgi:tetratricopeptide (TPR) repeat protein
MSEGEHPPTLPPRLSEQRDVPGTLLRRYLRQQPPIDEPQAWQHLRARLLPTPRLPVWLHTLAGAALATATILIGWRLTRTEPEVPTQDRLHGVKPAAPLAVETPRPARVPAPPPPAPGVVAPVQPLPALRLSRRAVSLPPGASIVEGEAEVTLLPPARALASRTRSGLHIELQAGRISLAVSHQNEGGRFEVAVAPYRFVVRGTRFQVTRGASRVQLEVSEGRVDVYWSGQLRASVRAGGAWRGPLHLPPPVAARQPPLDGPTDPIACSDVGDPRAALACYRARAAQGDLAAEVALNDGARLLRDTLGDLDQALALLREHRARFPRSALRTEVDLSLVELAARRGLHREVLEVSAALLAAQPQGERNGELHLLRGTAYREGLRDWASAEAEYARAAAAPGRARPQALYWRARCLEQLGRREEAISAYRTAIAQPVGTHAAEARRRLSALEREQVRPSRLHAP